MAIVVDIFLFICLSIVFVYSCISPFLGLRFFISLFRFLLYFSLCFCFLSFLPCIEISTSRIAESLGADSVIDRAPYLVRTYMPRINGPAYFDAPRLEMMMYSGSNAFIYDSQMNEDRLTSVGAWARQWQYWDGKGAIGSSAVGTLDD